MNTVHLPPYDEPAGLPEPIPPEKPAKAVPDATSAEVDRLPQELQKVRRRQKRWLVGCGTMISLTLLLSLVGFVVLIQRGVAEVKGMGPWPGQEILPEELVAVDLSHLGLEAGQIQSARDVDEWAGGNYEKGVLIEYESDGESVIYIWALRYEDKQTESQDYSSVQAWAGTAGYCAWSSYAYSGYSGVIHCQLSNGYDKIFWSDYWIVDIVTMEGTEYTPAVLVDKVRDAVSAHWKAIEAP